MMGGWTLFQSWPREGASNQRAADAQAPSILVVPFDNVGADPTHAFVARGLTYEIISHLTRFNELFVFGPATSFRLGSKDDTATGPSSLQASYVLMGSVHTTDALVKVSVILSDARTEQSLLSWTVERDLSGTSLMDIVSDIASHVAGTVAQPYGIVFDRTANEIAAKPATSLLSYECVVRARLIWRSDKYQDFENVLKCLETAIASDPGYAKAYSSSALLYVDAYRFGLGKTTTAFDPLQRALALARRAIELDPNSGDGYLALFMAQWFSKDVGRSIETARQGLALNPHNTDLLGELGLRYSLLGKWDLGMPLIAEAYARNPRGPTSYRVATSLNAYVHGDYRKALDEALLIDRPTVIYTHWYRRLPTRSSANATKRRRKFAKCLPSTRITAITWSKISPRETSIRASFMRSLTGSTRRG